MTDNRLKFKWVKKWSKKYIIASAVSQGIAFMADGISLEDLQYNKSILVKALYNKK